MSTLQAIGAFFFAPPRGHAHDNLTDHRHAAVSSALVNVVRGEMPPVPSRSDRWYVHDWSLALKAQMLGRTVRADTQGQAAY